MPIKNQPMRVLITGGYGCLGTWITKNLLLDRLGHSVFIYDLREDLKRFRLVMPEEQYRKAVFVPGDVTDLGRLRSAIDEHGITHIVHLAGLQVPTCRADPLRGSAVNVTGTLAVFEAARAAGPNFRRIVYASSAAVYGPPDMYPSDPLTEDVPLKPQTHYGAFKLCNEMNARIYFEEFGLTSIGLRPWAVFGVGRDFGMTSDPTKAILATALEKPFTISYGGYQDLQYVDDVSRAFIRCLCVTYTGAKAYNLRGYMCRMDHLLTALHGIDPRSADWIRYEDRQLNIAFDLDDSAFRRDIGPVEPWTTMMAAVRATYQHFRDLAERGLVSEADLATTAPAGSPLPDGP